MYKIHVISIIYIYMYMQKIKVFDLCRVIIKNMNYLL